MCIRVNLSFQCGNLPLTLAKVSPLWIDTCAAVISTKGTHVFSMLIFPATSCNNQVCLLFFSLNVKRGFFSAKMQSCKEEKSFEKGRGKSRRFFGRPLFPHCHSESPLFPSFCSCLQFPPRQVGAEEKVDTTFRFSNFNIFTRASLEQGLVFICFLSTQESTQEIFIGRQWRVSKNSFYQNWMRRLWEESKLQSDGGSIRMSAFEYFKIYKPEEFTIWYTRRGENSLGNF